jgi:E3 ubiquitin-protein ligase RGLG
MLRNYVLEIQVKEALEVAGLESSNLIIGVDFTKSNEWIGTCVLFSSGS